MDDPTGAIEGIRGTIETGFGKPTCRVPPGLGSPSASEEVPTCVNVAAKDVMTKPSGNVFPICAEHFERFEDSYLLVVVREL